MPIEIERKFLLLNDSWRSNITGNQPIVQGYLANTDKSSVRVRISGSKADINIKSTTLGVSRMEYEHPLPVNEAKEMLDQLCIQPLITKTRYFVEYRDCMWEIDVFEGENTGLIVAELELAEINDKIEMPDWIGREVSDDPRYYNMHLVSYPYASWADPL